MEAITLKLTNQNVERVLANCLFNVVHDDDTVNSNHIVVDGIVNKFSLDSELLQKERENIEQLLDQLPTAFKEGCSFNQMFRNREGDWWTGLNTVVEKLMVLGVAIGKITYVVPRELWWSLPSGRPYLIIN